MIQSDRLSSFAYSKEAMKKSSSSRNRISRLFGASLMTTALFSQGCLQRPVKQQSPNTSNVFVEQIQNTSINEIDMLFVIDNSVSMGDKQEILKVAVPKMVERLVAPNCVDGDGNVLGRSQLQGPDQPPVCASGSLEFFPVSDIHLGVVSSSLGGHGSTQCRGGLDETTGLVWYQDDKGRLIPTVRPDASLASEGNLGFLAWQGGTEADAEALIGNFRLHVEATGELGCGFEAPLEAWYRFLVDPLPPSNIVVNEANQADIARNDAGEPVVDTQVLAQRAAFLRPEGLVAIVVLTDENDCSIMDGGAYYANSEFGYLLASRSLPGKTAPYHLPVATAVCEQNPNDECCLSCLQRLNAPEQCLPALAEACNGSGDNIQGPAEALSEEADAINVRCFNNKKRFGVDLLYPTQRYVDALTRTEIIDARTNQTVDNPLLRSGGKVRPPGRVFFAGIIGVPWQDIATPESLDPANPDTMRYLTSADLSLPYDGQAGSPDRWEVILGKPNLADTSKTCQELDNPACGEPPTPPLDPFMREQIEPREIGAVNPIVPTEAIADPTSTDPRANNINGHEYQTNAVEREKINDDLQYACIFPLATPKDSASCETSVSCDCAEEPTRNRPLCQPASGGTEDAQYWGKAYPGTRILQVLRDFGANSIVGSICPKVTDDEDKPDYGYNPAVQAIVDRLAEKLVGACLPRELSIDENGEVPCFVVEAKPPIEGSDPLTCLEANGRYEVSEDVRASVLKQLAETKYCADEDHQGGADVQCSSYTMCAIKALQGAGRLQCLYDQSPADSLPEAGYCYIDPAKQSESGQYIAGGDAAEAKSAGFEATTPENGTNAIVKDCTATERRLLRFVGPDTPAEDTITLVACTGDAAGADAPIPDAPTKVESVDDAGI